MFQSPCLSLRLHPGADLKKLKVKMHSNLKSIFTPNFHTELRIKRAEENAELEKQHKELMKGVIEIIEGTPIGRFIWEAPYT